ncbi:alpha/beta hydrolase fold-domain-containing protein [Halteromyces radiatus]|uniref:alpha/beta hydrolase fold-domain-containing protein n=1 Tax=Halteromyces radiatus TaxID=101107 RepID=UPI002220CEFE|nr:alpha/beta hydrolase fold-domain-containing protein [Halteromyces radiatus]KAI8080069.1 alpha/beta hydrolase fold-domain-containing protein [Halteromyces radiatus]
MTLDELRGFGKNCATFLTTIVPEVAPLETKRISINVVGQPAEIDLTILRPKGTEQQVLPVAIYLHGGGWCIGSLFEAQKFVKDVVVKAHVAVIHVEYSLSPEVKYPVAVEECYSSILWIYENAASLNVDPSKLMIFGDSAGGNMSTVATILLKERGYGHVINRQILLYPAVARFRNQYDSYHHYGNGNYTLSHDEIAFFAANYHGENSRVQLEGGDWTYGPEEVSNAPILATLEQLKGLPRCLVVTAECDVLRDEGEEYVRRLTEAGVDACAVRIIGATHGYLTLAIPATIQYTQTLNLVVGFMMECS